MQLKVHRGALHLQGRYEDQEGMPPMQELDPPTRCYLVEYPGGRAKLFFSIPGAFGPGSVFQSSEMKEDRPANGERFFNDDFSNDPGSCSSTLTLTPQPHPSGNAFLYRQRFNDWIGVFIGGMLPIDSSRNTQQIPQEWIQQFENNAPSDSHGASHSVVSTTCELGRIAQMCMVADLFFMQATLGLESNQESDWLLNYIFPQSCFELVVSPILTQPESFGLSRFSDVKCSRLPNSDRVKVEFPNEEEQDRLHSFFTIVNEQRKALQGKDDSYPPMPDIYQGGPKPHNMTILDYLKSIEDSFNGTTNHVRIPVANGRVVLFR